MFSALPLGLVSGLGRVEDDGEGLSPPVAEDVLIGINSCLCCRLTLIWRAIEIEAASWRRASFSSTADPAFVVSGFLRGGDD